MSRPAVVVAISGLDPTGGAGIAADIEAIAAMGAHCCPLISCQTVQDSRGVLQLLPCDPQLLLEQARVLLADLRPDAFKLGALGSPQIVAAVQKIIAPYPDTPLVMDPVLAGGGGGSLARQGLLEALGDLLPRADLCTPNTHELAALAGDTDPEQALERLFRKGARRLLLTGTHAPGEQIRHQLASASGERQNFYCERLAGEYHGSGCTLAAALAARLAQGAAPGDACRSALDYCYRSLVSAYPLGQGQQFPRRLHRQGDLPSK
ncbi:bifunctional hydroxymethylpyrimidine kinase/phosphomethylpyrimidine kinase [Aestuariirhabdus litorea]|uniref:Hydroxymethylpyrimidine/phosphomethylpyrimidine kinase n=1 Tax=Aestuariirhabdus litorea TaxID=2528527 RepID=A0A3P3VPM5_9GAMM|nr:bifunctional hydroxymethylpyrimidine kinase/phosphomethylpyrimidine kinase [Aestuariirhabdus litorea]RRJ83589.1 hydroxymethylpyrimidine/phosphomethylpyrimidine kinase [Aestuariirhabdus litorea]RWW96810.1 hydroxymethylpyrimidine/phosphomethylpyrimidine kinase [Endozoicomonadaceae bacterium GTF-13]